jgi:hypothetical protein
LSFLFHSDKYLTGTYLAFDENFSPQGVLPNAGGYGRKNGAGG